MSKISFYIATWSANAEWARDFARRVNDLTMSVGIKTAPAYPWWDHLDLGPRSPAVMAALAHQTLKAACDADLFLLNPGMLAQGGAWCELGARLATNGFAHVLACPEPGRCFFSDHHPLVVQHADDRAFVKYVRDVLEHDRALP